MFSSLVDRYPCFNETKLQGTEKKETNSSKYGNYQATVHTASF